VIAVAGAVYFCVSIETDASTFWISQAFFLILKTLKKFFWHSSRLPHRPIHLAYFSRARNVYGFQNPFKIVNLHFLDILKCVDFEF